MRRDGNCTSGRERTMQKQEAGSNALCLRTAGTEGSERTLWSDESVLYLPGALHSYWPRVTAGSKAEEMILLFYWSLKQLNCNC